MVPYANKEMFLTESHDKNLTVSGTGIDIQNGNINKEEFTLEETLNSGDTLNFGECNSSKVTFTVGYYEKSIAGQQISVKTTPAGGADFVFGTYKVLSDLPTADRRWRKVEAYDALYEILKKDVTSWYNTLLPNATSSKTLKQFRDSFFSYIGITQKTVTLINDSMTVTRTIDPANLTGKTVLNAICQVNGVFGRIGRDGKFQYVSVAVPEEGLFPSETLYPSDTLYPRAYGFEDNPAAQNGTYLDCKYEEYLTHVIDKVQILNSENYEAGTAGSGSNVFIISDNFLLFDKETAELNTIAANILAKIGGIWYRPCELSCVAEPWLETGDGIRIHTVEGVDVDTIILKRKITGIQALKDSIIADGLENRPNDGNTTSEQIVQVKGNVRKVEADLIETKKLVADEIEADRAQIQDLYATKATVQQLNAVDAKFQNLNADNITAGTLSVDRLNINSLLLSFAGKQIGCDTLTAGTIQAVNTILFRWNGTYHSLFLNTIPGSDTVGGNAYNYVGWS